MSTQKSRPAETLQHIVSTFKQFEKKLDKLQDDVSYHSQTLSELRVMVANLSGGTLYDAKVENPKGVSKTTAMDSFHYAEPVKTKRKNAIHPMPSKVVTKSFQGQKYGIKPSKDATLYGVKKMPSSAKNALGAKRVLRPRKCESPRKATTIRSKKVVGKKQKGPQQAFEFQSLI